MLDVLVLCAVEFYGELVKRVIIASAKAHVKPCVSPLGKPVKSTRLHLAAVFLLIHIIFYLEQRPLLLQGEYR